MERQPAWEGEGAYTFVCYAHADEAEVATEIASLQAAGLNVWYDEGIAAGSEWTAVLAERIQNCATFLYFVTPYSAASEHCRRELSFALEEGRAIVVVHLVETDLSPALRLSLGNRQAILRYRFSQLRYEQKLRRAILDADGGVNTAAEGDVLRIGGADVYVARREVVRSGEAHRLEPKDLSVLLYLAEAAPAAVSTEELMTRCWPGVVVGDNALHQVVARLRKALGDDARNPHAIETQARYGYRLMCSLSVVVSQPPANDPSKATAFRWPGWAGWAVGAVLVLVFAWVLLRLAGDVARPDPSGRYAVMDLRDLSPGSDMAWLAEGVSADLRQQLSEAAGLDLYSPMLTRRADVADIPGDVRYLLDGSIQAHEGSVTVLLELLDRTSGQALWNERFEGSAADPLELQNQIVTRITRYLDHTVSAVRRGPTRSEAWQPFLKWTHYRGGGNFDEERRWLERTLDVDPDWATGWEEHAYVMGHASLFYGDTRYLEPMLRSIDAAERLGRNVNSLRGRYFFMRGELDLAERLMRTVLSDGDTFNYGLLMAASGLRREAAEVFEANARSNPLNSGAWDELAFARLTLGDFNGSIEAAFQCASLVHGESMRCHTTTHRALVEVGRVDEARAMLERLRNLKGDATRVWAHAAIARAEFWLQIRSGDTDGARASALRVAEAGRYLGAGFMYLLLGDVEAEEMFRRAEKEAPHQRWLDWAHHGYYGVAGELDSPAQQLADAWGYTNAWRLELCRRIAALPDGTGVRCNPSEYEL